MKKVISSLLFLTLVVTGLLMVSFNNNDVNAVDFSKFNAGNIMSDYVMSDKNSMTENDISNFIHSKITCDKPYDSEVQYWENEGYVYHIKNGHVVCIADEYEWFGNKTAASIIYKASQDYTINPQVLLVLLQKEQGLFNDKWPNKGQYDSATGYGCYDNNSACDPKFSGFENQIRSAASLYREVLSGGYSTYPVGWNYIQYNPDTSCGGTNVYVENRATSALYRFTPYQPNPATLSVPMWTKVPCGAYGNKNFFGIFTEWFGSTQKSKWESMDNPRIMQISVQTSTHKINPDTMEYETTNPLVVDRQIKFVQKTTLSNGSVCLRTEYDKTNNQNKCILLSELKNFEPIYEPISENETFQAMTRDGCKLDITKNEAICESRLKNNQIIKFIKKVTMLDEIVYITEHDLGNNNQKKGVRATALEAITNYEEIEPTYLTLKLDSKKHRLSTGVSEGDTFNMSLTRKFVARAKVDNVWYYQTDSNKNDSYRAAGFPEYSLVKPVSIDFEVPRSMKLKGNACKIDPITNKKGSCWTNIIRKFVKKIYINDEWYYQTEENAANNSGWYFNAKYIFDL